MNINHNVLQKLIAGAGMIAGLGGLGYVVHDMGYKSGANRMANEMTREFSDMNVEENKNIFNQAYNEGASAAVDNLSAMILADQPVSLDKLSEYAFVDELKKICTNINK